MDEQAEFKVLGCGLPRTGTMSLQHALEILYHGPCLHGFKILSNSLPVISVLEHIDNDDIVKGFFKKNSYVASTDAPFCYYYERILKIYPNAKFVVTTRNPKLWVESSKATIFRFKDIFEEFPSNLYFFNLFYFIDHSVYSWYYFLSKRFKLISDMQNAIDENRGEEFYENWLVEVKSKIPDEKLLVFNVTEGWEPLCKFLELPVPDVPFPNINDRSSFNEMMSQMRFVSWVVFIGLASVPIIGGVVMKYFRVI